MTVAPKVAWMAAKLAEHLVVLWAVPKADRWAEHWVAQRADSSADLSVVTMVERWVAWTAGTMVAN